MDIRQSSQGASSDGFRPARTGKVSSRSDITRSNRQGIEKTLADFEQAREAQPADSPDQVALSPAGQLFARADGKESSAASDLARTERVVELKQAHDQGTLNTPERVEKAAAKLLSGL